MADLRRQKEEVTKTVPTTLVSIAVPPRAMRVLPRGNWLDDSGEIVAPGTPASLPPLKFKGDRATRLDLAKWMVSADNPLVARVFVNRLWKLLFGSGLATSLQDFGAQGAWPNQPALLDYLAVELRDHGWSMKHLHRLIVTSRAYRLTSSSAGAASINLAAGGAVLPRPPGLGGCADPFHSPDSS